jgi:C4-type Zn-finger protein
MGMFDTIHIACPNCGATLDFQSKAGPCSLLDYTLDSAPPEVLAGLTGEKGTCVCGACVEFQVRVIIIPYIKRMKGA